MTVHGGRLKEIPNPWRRKWPDSDEPRRVRVKFLDWSAGGGHHISLTIEEEHNYLWNGEAWQECWDDDDGQGFELKTKFERYEDAVKVARAVVRIMFSDKARYNVLWDGVRQTRYIYARQSD